MSSNRKDREGQPQNIIYFSDIVSRKLGKTTSKQRQEFVQQVNSDRAILDYFGVKSILDEAIESGLVKPNETLKLLGSVVRKKETRPIIEYSVNNPNSTSLDSKDNRRVYIKLIFGKRFHGLDDCVGFTQSEVEVAVINEELGLKQHDGSYLLIEEGQLISTIQEAIKNPITTTITN